jgi:hypothetical protein
METTGSTYPVGFDIDPRDDLRPTSGGLEA